MQERVSLTTLIEKCPVPEGVHLKKPRMSDPWSIPADIAELLTEVLRAQLDSVAERGGKRAEIAFRTSSMKLEFTITDDAGHDDSALTTALSKLRRTARQRHCILRFRGGRRPVRVHFYIPMTA